MTVTTIAAVEAKPFDITNELDNALADLEVAGTFLEASDNFLDELRRWMAPDGCGPNPALLQVVHHAQTLLAELDIRMKSADQRVHDALRGFNGLVRDRMGGTA